MRGDTLYNYTDHGLLRGRNVTDSVGFCFFVENPDEAKHWLSGIVDFDYCMTFDVPSCYVRRAKGCYPIQYGLFIGSGYRTEYCCTSYSQKTFKLLSATKCFSREYPDKETLRRMFPMLFV